MSSETAIVDAWLNSTLKGDVTLQGLVGQRVTNTPPLAGITLPCIRYAYQPRGQDLSGADGGHHLSRLFYEVYAVGKPGDPTALKTIADRIDALLAGAHVTTTDAAIRVRRQSPIEMPDAGIGATRYAHLGGVYRFYVSPL